ncbi:MAG: DUF11 domain-containing protein [Pirellulaceae bacterium]|nr:DUF11 domain-containing protein [Pirellulaceae bacterium]
MKKTSTRLATAAAVLLMSAFAIVLAHHDARQRDLGKEDASLPSSVIQTTTTPLALDTDSTALTRPTTVRANNQYPAVDQQFPTQNEAPLPPAQRYSTSPAAIERLPEFDSLSSATELVEADIDVDADIDSDYSFTDSDVLPVGGENSVLPLPPSATSNLLAERPASLPLIGSQPSAMLSSPQPASPPPHSTGLMPLPNSVDAPPAFSSDVQRPSMPRTDLRGSNDAPGWLGNNGNSTATGPSPTQLSMPPSTLTPAAAQPTTQGFGQSYTQPAMQPVSQQPGQLPSALSTAQPGSSLNQPSRNYSDGGFETSSVSPVPRGSLISNQPGNRYLDGSQNPVMQIQKRAPEETQVGKRASLVITVRNAGNATAHEVTVVDRVPRGARLIESSPPVSPTPDGTLVWQLGEMASGDERTINLQIVPEIEGEVGSVASVHFAAQASVRTVVTAPKLELQIESIGPVIIGQSQQVVVLLRNMGTGVARGIRMEADVPGQLRHESGEAQLEAVVGDLRPNETRRMTLSVAAVQPGQAPFVVRAVNDDGVQADHSLTVDVRAPQLAATIAGPALRYLERQANYQVVVTNTGTAIARNLDFVVHLPVGLKFVSVDIPQASYHPQSHSITLGLAELDAGQAAPFTLTVLPVQLGQQVVRFNATGDLNISAEAKAQVTVSGLAELSFTIGQDNGTVEVGATTTYAVQVTNIGNQPDKNVQLQVQLPEGTKLLQVDAPVEYRVEPNRITFAPVAEMRNRDVKTFRFQVQHNRAGNQVVRSQLTSENWPVAVVKEEGTLVYNDQN